jgi:hypothetical protein
MRGFVLSVVLLATVALAGCGGGDEFTYESYKATVGGVAVEIVPGGDKESSRADETKDDKGNVLSAIVTSGEVRVEIKNAKRTAAGVQYDLVVNGEAKGTIVRGGDIVVQNGITYVMDPRKGNTESEER